MNPYLTVPVVLPGDGSKQAPKKKIGKILPGNVTFYHEGYDRGTFLYGPFGAIEIEWSLTDYEQKVRDYFLELGKEAARQQREQKKMIAIPGQQ